MAAAGTVVEGSTGDVVVDWIVVGADGAADGLTVEALVPQEAPSKPALARTSEIHGPARHPLHRSRRRNG